MFGHHGVGEQEREAGQELFIDVECELDASRAAASDRLEDTVDYAALIQSIKQLVGEKSFFLLEALGEAVAAQVLVYPTVETVRVRISKPALSGADLHRVGVVIERSRHQAGDQNRL